jgi:hypothetical protein
VSLRAFQRAQVAMIVDADVARRISAGDFGPWEADLTSRERERLVSQATDTGLALSRKLHKGWRLTKLLTLLPVTFRVGDPDLLLDLVDTYWRHYLPQGLYFEAEAARFAAFVAERVPGSALLHDAVSLEGALLAVGQRTPLAQPAIIELHITRDPRRLLSDPSAMSSGSSGEPGGFDVTVIAGPTGPNLLSSPCTGDCAAGQQPEAIANFTAVDDEPAGQRPETWLNPGMWPKSV